MRGEPIADEGIELADDANEASEKDTSGPPFTELLPKGSHRLIRLSREASLAVQDRAHTPGSCTGRAQSSIDEHDLFADCNRNRARRERPRFNLGSLTSTSSCSVGFGAIVGCSSYHHRLHLRLRPAIPLSLRRTGAQRYTLQTTNGILRPLCLRALVSVQPLPHLNWSTSIRPGRRCSRQTSTSYAVNRCDRWINVLGFRSFLQTISALLATKGGN